MLKHPLYIMQLVRLKFFLSPGILFIQTTPTGCRKFPRRRSRPRRRLAGPLRPRRRSRPVVTFSSSLSLSLPVRPRTRTWRGLWWRRCGGAAAVVVVEREGVGVVCGGGGGRGGPSWK